MMLAKFEFDRWIHFVKNKDLPQKKKKDFP